MSDGVQAIEGFDYQAMVTLELALEHLGRFPDGRVRPEGRDDVDLDAPGANATQYVQIKKPRRTITGELKNEPWTIAQAAAALLPPAIAKVGMRGEQVWILGDDLDPDLVALLTSGANASTKAQEQFLRTLHLICLEDCRVRDEARQKLSRIRLLARGGVDPVGELVELVARAVQGIESPLSAAAYEDSARRLSPLLTAALSRIDVRPNYGTEDQIRERVTRRLADDLRVSVEVARDALTRNLRGFINDVAKQRRSFDRRELEIELRVVWPELVPVKDRPLPPLHHLRRKAIVAQLAIS